jgi:hypothetical protein
MLITNKQNVIVNMQELEDNFNLVTVAHRTGAYEKYGVLIEIDNQQKHLVIVEGLEDNGVNTAVTKLSHWYFDGYLWVNKPKQRLSKENENIKRFVEGQNFDIWTSTWKYLKIVNNKPVYLDSVLDAEQIWHNGAEILNLQDEKFNLEQEILNENGESFEPKQYASFEPKQYNSYEPKQYEKILNSGIMDAYTFNEMIIRPSQLSEISNRFPSIGEVLNF